MPVEPPRNSCHEPPVESSSEAVKAGREHRVKDGDTNDLLSVVLASVDYRGDVTITRKSDVEPVVGYVHDFRQADDPAQAEIRLLPADGGERIVIQLADIAAIEFTGKDAAEGRSFDTWVKEYASRKILGEPPEAS